MKDQALVVMILINEPIRIVGTRRQPTDSLQLGKESSFPIAYLFTVHIVLYFFYVWFILKAGLHSLLRASAFKKAVPTYF